MDFQRNAAKRVNLDVSHLIDLVDTIQANDRDSAGTALLKYVSIQLSAHTICLARLRLPSAQIHRMAKTVTQQDPKRLQFACCLQ